MSNILEAIYKSGLKFLVPLTPEETYATIVDEALKLIKEKHGSIFIEEEGELKRVYTSDPILYNLSPRKRGKTYKVFKSHKPIIQSAKKITKVHPEYHKAWNELKIKAGIAVPLSYKNESIGVLSVLSTGNEIATKESLDVLKYFGPLASLAIRKTQLYSETKKALEVRDLFIALAAHELRTPLTTLNGYIQLLYNNFSKKQSPEFEWIKQLSHESGRLTHLVQELLEINKAQTGKLNYVLAEHSLKDIIKEAIDNFSFSFPKRELIFKNELKEKKDIVIGDFTKLVQMLNNILNNSAKFSKADKSIILDLESDRSYFIIKVQDYGQGISEDDQKKIFQLFYKGKSNVKEGLGLGLYLTKNIIERHHGSIGVKSHLKKGTTIEVKLPKAKI